MGLVDILKAILFGIVEGVTEWLPISSTGHMIILEEVLKIKDTFSDEFWNLFLVVIQLGAILAVIIIFFGKLWPFGKNKTQEEKKSTWVLWLKVVVACIPAIIGVFFNDFLEKYLYNFITVSITLIVYGIIFIVLEKLNKKRQFKITDVKEISFKTALIIGFVQMLALIPGTSRSGVTILGAMILGCDRSVSAEFSFFLSIPIMIGASLLKIVKYLMNVGFPSNSELLFLGIGCIVAFGVSLFVIKFLMSYIKKKDFTVFGYYRIVLGLLLILYFVASLS